MKEKERASVIYLLLSEKSQTISLNVNSNGHCSAERYVLN